MMHMPETIDEFRNRLNLEKVVHIADVSKYWEVEIKSNTKLTSEDFMRLNIEKILSHGNGTKCIYVPKL